MKKPKLPNFRSLGPQPKVPMNKLKAHAKRLTHSAYDDHEEPTTKLSTAFVVVLALHVVAVAGIYAFHSIKAKRREADGTAVAAKSVAPPTAVAAAPAPAAPSAAVATPPAAPGAGNVAPKITAAPAPVKTENTASRLPAPAGASAVIPPQKAPIQNTQATPSSGVQTTTVAAKAQPPAVAPVKAVAAVPAVLPVASSAPEVSSKTYTVVRGDNPVAIAKRMHVNYEEMLKINNIEDPKKLQIGQVLKMPVSRQNN